MSRLAPLLALLFIAPLRAQEVDVAGTYIVANAGAATRNRDAAIDDVVSQMNVLARGIARRRLTAGTPVHRRIRIDRHGEELRVRIGDAYDFRAPADGTRRRFVDGFDNEMEGRMTLRGQRLELVFESEDAIVRHTLQIGANGLRFRVRIHSDRLPADVDYRTRYRRRR